MIMRCALLFLMAATALPAFAQAQTAKPDTYVHAGRLLDKPGQAARGPSTIIIRDGKIAEVRSGLVAPPAGATLIDLSTQFVLPGLIDSHVHLRSDAGGVAGLVEGLTGSEAVGAYVAADNARKTLMAGFTTVRNLGDGGATLALRDAIAKGIMVGPRIIDAGRSISTTGGHMDGRSGLAPFIAEHVGDENLCDGVESCRQAVRIQIRRGADVIKIATTGGVNSGTGRRKMAFDDEIKALVDTAHMYGRKIAAHAHGVEGVNAALAAGIDSIEHGTEMNDETLVLFKKSGAYYVPTLSTVNGYIERLAANPNAYEPKVLEQIRWRIGITGKSLQRAVPAGVRIAFGTDAGVSKHGKNAEEFELMVKYGMTPAAAIEAATVNAAKLLGVDAEVGTLEPGKSADLIAVAGDPLTDVTVLKTVPFVMKGGTIFKQ
jgi:imidazolonepropionase-like amidohydrolase